VVAGHHPLIACSRPTLLYCVHTIFELLYSLLQIVQIK